MLGIEEKEEEDSNGPSTAIQGPAERSGKAGLKARKQVYKKPRTTTFSDGLSPSIIPPRNSGYAGSHGVCCCGSGLDTLSECLRSHGGVDRFCGKLYLHFAAGGFCRVGLSLPPRPQSCTHNRPSVDVQLPQFTDSPRLHSSQGLQPSPIRQLVDV